MEDYYSYPNYRGIYYAFIEDKWVLYRDYICGTVMWFADESYRIDQCIAKFLYAEENPYHFKSR